MTGKPECKGEVSLMEGESTELLCSVSYNGNMPVLEWFRNGQETEGTDKTDIQKAGHLLKIGSATYIDDGAIYTCRMTIADKKEECTQKLNVKYQVRDIKLTPETDVINIGQEIRCQAYGNPEPKITFEPETTSVYEGRNYRAMTVDDEWLNQLTTVSCKAQNEYEGKFETIEKSITFNVTVPKAKQVVGGGSQNTAASILVFFSSLVFIIHASLASLL